ncbi:hypothetical protein [Roseomonas sp. KE0001]|uniref:hypothetical protein n=1 Tax=unclassified Roseomonas TaxID=2617492 RepID=UPI0018DEF22A|nr:hypothetical protein [Roseomonas sp. KE0001]MBI0434055.1 hypothetical protein [Roseomonas sp. KE0001]
MSEYTPPRRIAPQTGDNLWTGTALTPADWMLPLGGEVTAEIASAGETATPLPRLDPLLGQVAERLAHGLGFCLLRGMKLPEAPAERLSQIGRRLGRPLPQGPAEAPDPAPGGKYHTEPCDALLLLCREGVEVALFSAAALHNEVLKTDRPALEVLYGALPTGPETGLPVFAVTSGVFAARCERMSSDPALCGPAWSALERAAQAPGMALRLMLHPGDLLCVNPFLVWATRRPQLEALAVMTENSRLSEGAFAALRGEAG